METREVSSLPIASSLIDLLINNGFRYTSSLKDIQPLDLAAELSISASVALSILESLSRKTNEATLNDLSNITASSSSSFSMIAPVTNKTLSAHDIYKKTEHEKPIITFCRALDQIIGGGIQKGQITEFCGAPGIGKTQMGIQLVLNVQIPLIFKGCQGEAVYIDTEGSFMIERVAKMAEGLQNHLIKIAKIPSKKEIDDSHIKKSVAEESNIKKLLSGIHVFRAHDQTEQLCIINHLSKFLSSHLDVQLLVIDSIAFHFRQDLQDTSARNRILSTMSQTLNKLAFTFNIAIVVINHITTRIEVVNNKSNTILVPALGEQWSHCVTNRVMMNWNNGLRIASLTKSAANANGEASYQVCELGIRDVVQLKQSNVTNNGNNENKRQKI